MTLKNTILLFLTAGIGWLALTSYSSGPAFGGLGDLSSSNCSGGGCHSVNSSATVVQNVVLVDVSGGTLTPAGQYIPGRTYAVSILGSLSPANASLTHFGFQTTARDNSNSTVGTVNLSGTSQIRIYSAGNRTGVEHSTKIAKNSGGFLTKTWQWTAPPAGTGSVTFHTIINAVNNNSAVTGDQPNADTTVFTEATLSVDDVATASQLAISPNPAKDRIRIDTRGWRTGEYNITVFSSTGAVVMREAVRHTGSEALNISLPQLSTGLYGVHVQGKEHVQTAPLFIR